MGLQKITFEGSSVTAKVDAEINHFLLSKQIGIISEFKNGVNFTVSNNTITFKEGYVSIFGRLIYVEENTQINIPLDSSKKGFVVIGVNTSDNTVNLYTKEQVGSYPSITKTDLLKNDGLYELVLCAYSKTAMSLTIDYAYKKEYINSYLAAIDELKFEIENNKLPRQITPNYSSNGVYTINNVDVQSLMKSIIFVQISSTIVILPGALLFFQVGSNASVGYRYAGADYIMNFHYGTGILTISSGSTSHHVSKVYIYQK